MKKETSQLKANYLKFKDLKAEYNLPASTVYNLIKTENFPKQIKLSPQTAVFKRTAVDAWFKHREELSEVSA